MLRNVGWAAAAPRSSSDRGHAGGDTVAIRGGPAECARATLACSRGPGVMQRTIGDIAKFVTSKNAGPFLLTLDVVFPDEATYRRFKALGALDRATVARLYGIAESDVLK